MVRSIEETKETNQLNCLNDAATLYFSAVTSFCLLFDSLGKTFRPVVSRPGSEDTLSL